ncbi:hypothetical protein [cf. Phormidesmis sp. LEGE 11477]|uniref:hypothetical protein n=1 Tax=cf. Phormidesmis sp. LEGE 11477 TaxID=1828680 RepID=UPI00187EA3EE|nr:hypothetical protein [cf. Phormidesmis sp. LEGE 11477]MBE9061137.1 hypothetical protein [cf. Phormidesmis sp. LEGE 11477]
MSENQSENQTSLSLPSSKTNQPGSPSDADSPVVDGLVAADVPRQMTMSSIVSDSSREGAIADGEMTDDAWDTVDLPGTVASANSGAISSGTNSAAMGAGREQELLTLIHDLNECNDVLLSKVSRLETALKGSQQAVQSEVERARATQEKLAEQMSAQQAIAQQTAQTAQQQVAKLVGQIDTAEQALQRQQLIQETLQAELDEAQGRITQLERECALITQQHADEAQARIKADTINRDLRSRLQRQQRYTLQFKAALEKSLSVNTRSAATAAVVSEPVSFNDEQGSTQPGSSAAVTMPRAERIVPWAAIGSAPFAGIDPHLENLIRGQAEAENFTDADSLETSHSEFSRLDTNLEAGAETVEGIGVETGVERSHSATVDSSSEVPVVDPEAEKRLWQDIERVMGVAAEVTGVEGMRDLEADTVVSAATASKTGNTDTGTTDTRTVDDNSARAETVDVEPRLNWQTESAPPVDPTVSSPATASGRQNADDFPSIDSETVNSETTAVSPIVNPLRPQRKIGSLAAVKLPTFEKAKAGSFKR